MTNPPCRPASPAHALCTCHRVPCTRHVRRRVPMCCAHVLCPCCAHAVPTLCPRACRSAMDITPLSLYQNEKESLLAPGTKLKVCSGSGLG